MADTTNLTRTYTIPLRKRFVDVPRYKRAKRAVKTVRAFLERHMKSDDVKIGPKLNEKLWVHGIKNPPARVTVTATKDKDGVVKAELEGYAYVDFKIKEKTPDKNASMQEKLKQKVQDAKGGPKQEEDKEPAKQEEDQKSATQGQPSASQDAGKGVVKKTTTKAATEKQSSTKQTSSKKTASSKKTSTKKSTTSKKSAEESSTSGSRNAGNSSSAKKED
ncbi:MAG: 50S ribosomal protein L31e [Nanobdellota archaeon]